MQNFLNDSGHGNIPFHTRFGLRFLQLLLIIFALLLVRRCIVIYQDNRIPNEQQKLEYFEKGYASGMKKAHGFTEETEPEFSNESFRKAYRDGYRQGWDEGQKKTELQ
jgi:hypothetical protein